MISRQQRTEDELYMFECLALAKKGAGYVSPNPMVGAIVVKNGRVVGRGFHRKFGGPHAEVYALRAANRMAKGATLYVNLEPCCHHGKTGPCTDLIIKSGIRRVVVGMKDPNVLVSGKGIAQLKKKGIRVDIGILESRCRIINETFVKFITTGLPFITLKVAQTLDGKIADVYGNSRWITNERSRALVQALRSQYDAVLVGANTVRMDNPRLTVREVRGRDPYRIILDGNFTARTTAKVFTHTDGARTILFVDRDIALRKRRRLRELRKRGTIVHLLVCKQPGKLDLKQVLRIVASHNIASILVEGGAYTFSEFVRRKLVDKLIIMIASKILGPGHDSFGQLPPRRLAKVLKLSYIDMWNLNGDFVVEAYPRF